MANPLDKYSDIRDWYAAQDRQDELERKQLRENSQERWDMLTAAGAAAMIQSRLSDPIALINRPFTYGRAGYIGGYSLYELYNLIAGATNRRAFDVTSLLVLAEQIWGPEHEDIIALHAYQKDRQLLVHDVRKSNGVAPRLLSGAVADLLGLDNIKVSDVKEDLLARYENLQIIPQKRGRGRPRKPRLE